MKRAPWQPERSSHDFSQELRRQLAGQVSAAPQQATVKKKLGVRFVCEDRQSEFCTTGPQDRRLTFHDSWTHPLGSKRSREAAVR